MNAPRPAILSRIILCSLISLIFSGVIFPASSPLSAQTSPEKTEKQADDLQKTIDLLEDDEKRAEVVKLLRLMEVINTETGQPMVVLEEKEELRELSPAEAGLKAYLRTMTARAWRSISTSGAALEKAKDDFNKVVDALSETEAVNIWRPYFFKISIWGLACLLCTWFLMRKYGRSPIFTPTFTGRVTAVIKYILAVGSPNLVLILSLLAMPKLATTTAGVTADMATGFDFLYALIQHFFVNLSALYIFLQVMTALFRRNEDGHSIIDVHPVLGRQILGTLRVFAIYLACFVFFKETLLEHFASGSLYALCIVLMTIPGPFYLTRKLIVLNRLIHMINEAEFTADQTIADCAEDELEAEADHQPPFEYMADIFLKKHWVKVAIASVWLVTFLSLLSPMDSGSYFAGRLVASISAVIVAMLLIKAGRLLVRRFASENSDNGKGIMLRADSLTNLLVWLLTLTSILTIWGLPLDSLLRNAITIDILSRAFTICLVAAAVIFFMKFSHLATDWLMASPNYSGNRNWRTMGPLLLTAARALAVFIGCVVILERLGVNVGPILAGAGILGLGVGMGAQSLVKDVINGISILTMDTLSVGDYVTIAGKSGTVESVGLRTIRLRDSSGNLVVIPNSSIDTTVNMTRDYSQDLVEFIAPYDADPDEMLKMSREVAEDLSGDQKWKGYLTAPISVLGVTNFDPNGTTIRLKINTTAGNQWLVGRELKLRLKRRMLKDGLSSKWFGQNVFYFNDNGSSSQSSDNENAEPEHLKKEESDVSQS